MQHPSPLWAHCSISSPAREAVHRSSPCCGAPLARGCTEFGDNNHIASAQGLRLSHLMSQWFCSPLHIFSQRLSDKNNVLKVTQLAGDSQRNKLGFRNCRPYCLLAFLLPSSFLSNFSKSPCSEPACLWLLERASKCKPEISARQNRGVSVACHLPTYITVLAQQCKQHNGLKFSWLPE